MTRPDDFQLAIESLIRKHTDPLERRIKALEEHNFPNPDNFYAHYHEGYDYYSDCERCIAESGSL